MSDYNFNVLEKILRDAISWVEINGLKWKIIQEINFIKYNYINKTDVNKMGKIRVWYH